MEKDRGPAAVAVVNVMKDPVADVAAVQEVAEVAVATAPEILPNPKNPNPILKEDQTFFKPEGIFREFIVLYEFPGNFQIPI